MVQDGWLFPLSINIAPRNQRAEAESLQTFRKPEYVQKTSGGNWEWCVKEMQLPDTRVEESLCLCFPWLECINARIWNEGF
jgi:hypothetical protein